MLPQNYMYPQAYPPQPMQPAAMQGNSMAYQGSYPMTDPLFPTVYDPYFYPMEYAQALKETAKQIRQLEKEKQEKDENGEKPYQLPTKPFKPEWIDIEEFAAIFKEMILYEVKCEQLRIQLALQPDFRIPVLYRIFDRAPRSVKKNQEYVMVEEFLKGCKTFAIDADPVDVKLVMSKYKDQTSMGNVDDVTLSYQEFYALFYPLSKNNLFDEKLNRNDTESDRFFYRTNMMIERLLRMMLSQEDAFEYFRREIVRKNLDLEKIYNKINLSREKSISAEEIRLFLIDYGLAVSKEDLSLFMKRLDRRESNTITLDDFKREFNPRLGIKKR